MAQRIVEGSREARQATKENLVRYILMVSTALVVILFVVGYILAV